MEWQQGSIIIARPGWIHPCESERQTTSGDRVRACKLAFPSILSIEHRSARRDMYMLAQRAIYLCRRLVRRE